MSQGEIMRTSMLAEAPSGHTPPVRVRRHHRSRIVVATGALTLLAIAAGAGIALLDRPSPEPTAPARAAGTPTAARPSATPAAATSAQDQGGAAAAAQPATRATQDQGGAAGPAVALADGSYPAFIRKIDSARRTMVVDVVQVFEGKAAFQAGIEDGLGQDAAAVRDPYIRNQNPLLRTLPIARQATIQFMGTCEGPAGGSAALGTLARHATTSEFFYYMLTVRDGSVRRIVEHQAQPAC
jgi:hypothetical protein